jgi:hypothetical protein
MPDFDTPLILHHGTTLRAASAILRTGWQPQSVTAILDRVAAEHGLSKSEIINDLAKFGRYALQDDRGTWASFTPSLAKAEHSWAQRAPEAEWEALWTAYRIAYMDEADSWHWTTNVAGHTWVWDQMRNEALAVVSVTTSYSEIVTLDAFTHGFQRRPLPARKLLLDHWDKLTEIGFDLPFQPELERLTVSPVERHLPWDVYANKLGITPGEFQRRADSGDFGRPASESADYQDHFPAGPWWNSSTAPFLAD